MKKRKVEDIDEIGLHNLDAILRGVNFLAQFSLAELEKFISRLKKISFKKGEVVVKEGEEGDSFYFISRGKVSVWIKRAMGKKLLKYLGPGDYFGEMSLLVGGKRNATITVEEDADFFMLSKEDFRSMLIDNPSLMDMIIRTSENRKAELVITKYK